MRLDLGGAHGVFGFRLPLASLDSFMLSMNSFLRFVFVLNIWLVLCDELCWFMHSYLLVHLVVVRLC